MEKKDIAMSILLSIITCGIYTIFWMISINDDVVTITDKKYFDQSGGTVFLFTLLTCGIYGIYWDKKTINKVWNKLKLIKEKVHQKSKADYSFISNAIQNNQDEFILTYLKDEKFKKFYRNKDSIFPDDVFMEKMIDQCKFNLILEIIKDPCYIMYKGGGFFYDSGERFNKRKCF